MKNKLLIMAIVLASAVGLFGCATQLAINQGVEYLSKVTVERKPQAYYQDLNKGVEVHMVTTQPAEEITKATRIDKVVYHMSGKPIFYAPTVNYVRSMGLTEMSPATDYHLYITIKRADYGSYTAAIDLNVSLKDSKGDEVFTQKNISTSVRTGYPDFSESYTQALEQINWNRIASFLRTEQLPKDEPDKQVQGQGDTALEQTIIRWDVQSRPQGADIFWRVVSKTPEVKSTNNKYLQTTPYEATKALDIRGLTYQTSGNVRIILRCEKEGYLPQEKEYDVRMVIDQEEISAFFRLVKDE